MLAIRYSAINHGWGYFFLAAFFLAVFAICQFWIPSSAYAGSALSKGHREALKRSCNIKVLRGEYKNMTECRRKEVQRIVSQRELVTLNNLTKSKRKRFQLACLKAKDRGILAYDNCLYDELFELGLRQARAKLPQQLPHKVDSSTPSKPVTASKFRTVNKLTTSSLVALLEKGTVLILTQGNTGSGFFIAPGLILTNGHVIEKTRGNIYITSRAIGQIHKAKIIVGSTKPGAPGERDFALLSVDRSLVRNFSLPINLTPSKLESVIAAGYPGLVVGRDESFNRLLKGDFSAAPDLVLSKGEISAKQKSEGGVDTLVHTAQIMPGNSGGPLVDGCGRVVGINTFIAVERTGKVGFALSSQEVLKFLNSHNVTAKVDKNTCSN